MNLATFAQLKDMLRRIMPVSVWGYCCRWWFCSEKLIVNFFCEMLTRIKPTDDKEIIIVLTRSSGKEREVISRLRLYQPNVNFGTLRFVKGQKASIAEIFSSKTFLVGDDGYFPQWVMRSRQGIFNVDYDRNYYDGWEWHSFLNLEGNQFEYASKEAHQKLIVFLGKIQQEAHLASCVFGTGPSLVKAFDKDWSDTFRVVCNTIVRDTALWKHIKPHILVAGDAIYHFGQSSYARAFRRDLAERLRETNTLFVYPTIFHSFVAREFAEFRDRLVPIPSGEHKRIDVDLVDEFFLPKVGNVLPLLLLPLACTLAKQVFMLGFDGRAPSDKLFWSNSSRHSYPEHMEELRHDHPAFFNHYVPSTDPDRYVRQVHGDALENLFQEAEKRGWSFTLLQESWTPTLQKRYREELWTALPNKLPRRKQRGIGGV